MLSLIWIQNTLYAFGYRYVYLNEYILIELFQFIIPLLAKLFPIPDLVY
jgi:hypothetical protein